MKKKHTLVWRLYFLFTVEEFLLAETNLAEPPGCYYTIVCTVPNMCRDTFYLAGKSEIRYITKPYRYLWSPSCDLPLVTSATILFAASYIRYKLLVSYLGLILAGTSFYDLLGLNLTSKSTFSKRKHGTFFFLSGRLWKLAY